jgi:hypothetical protein
MEQQHMMGIDINLAPQAEDDEDGDNVQILLSDLNIVEGNDQM